MAGSYVSGQHYKGQPVTSTFALFFLLLQAHQSSSLYYILTPEQLYLSFYSVRTRSDCQIAPVGLRKHPDNSSIGGASYSRRESHTAITMQSKEADNFELEGVQDLC